ncbi:MAG: hypothetical protein Q7S00_00700, partial [bacterium]|nr:hypothetical protein [bacterium]
VRGDLWQSMITIIATTGIFLIFLYSLFRGKFTRLGKVELFCLVAAFLVGIVWKTTGDAIFANLLLQGIYFISFIPTVLGLLKGTMKDRSLPWVLAFIAYALMIIVILLRWSEGSWAALAHPIINGLLGNGSIALITFFNLRVQEGYTNCLKEEIRTL